MPRDNDAGIFVFAETRVNLEGGADIERGADTQTPSAVPRSLVQDPR